MEGGIVSSPSRDPDAYRIVGVVMTPLLVSFIVGTALPFLHIAGEVFPLVAALSAAVLLFVYRRFDTRIALISFAVVLGLAAGSFRSLLDIQLPSPSVPTGKHTLIGTIAREPDIRESRTHLVVEVESLDGLPVERPYRVLIFAPRFPEFTYGERVVATGTIAAPEDFALDDTGRTFPYKSYLKKEDIYAIVRYPTIEGMGPGKANVLLKTLYSGKRAFLEALARVVPEPRNALLGGLILGEKRSLGEKLTEAFRTSGIIHIVVLSGYNMTLVARYLYAFFGFLGFYGRAFVAVLGIALFAFAAGGGATVVRAAIMASIALLAKVTGRTGEATRALLVAAALMLFHEPSIILYDPSFQLSFIATLGLIHGTAYLEPRISWFKNFSIIREILLSTLATQAFVLPFLLFMNGTLSVYALPANLLALPLVPVAMFFGFWAGAIALISPIVAFPIGFLANLSASWILFVGTSIASMPYAFVVVPAFPPALLLLVYGFFWMIIRLGGRRHPSASSPQGIGGFSEN